MQASRPMPRQRSPKRERSQVSIRSKTAPSSSRAPRAWAAEKESREAETKYYYHYTTASNLHKIMESGVLRPSKNSLRDALLGPGVYLTTKLPQTSDDRLSTNNYDNARRGAHDERLQAYIRIPVGQLRENTHFCRDLQERSVCVVRGAIDLRDMEGVVYGLRKRYGR